MVQTEPAKPCLTDCNEVLMRHRWPAAPISCYSDDRHDALRPTAYTGDDAVRTHVGHALSSPTQQACPLFWCCTEGMHLWQDESPTCTKATSGASMQRCTLCAEHVGI
jgi:hypothetical protein